MSNGTSAETDNRFVGTVDVTHWATPMGRSLADAHHRLASRIGSHGALAVSLIVGGGVAAVATVAATRIYDSVASSNGIESLDRPALRTAMALRSPVTDGLSAGIARVFGPVGMPIVALAASGAMALSQRSRTPVVLAGAAALGSLAMTLAGKDMIHRHRPPRRDAIPPYESSPSFPSGHTLNATTIVGVLAYLAVLRQQRTLPQVATVAAAVGTALTVGLSRVLLGAHWFTDVLVGWVTGSGWLALVVTSHRLYLTSARKASV
jgi:membrane-associated phospholipid phosphatase